MSDLDLFIKKLQEELLQESPELWWAVAPTVYSVKEDVEPTPLPELEPKGCCKKCPLGDGEGGCRHPRCEYNSYY